jgi:hypothetical protein
MNPMQDEAMITVLQELLESDRKITAREVARRHPTIRQASSITRNSERARLLAEYQARQAELWAWRKRVSKTSKTAQSDELARRDHEIAKLRHEANVLKAGMLVMLRVVPELGGTTALLRFYEGFSEARREMARLGIFPEAAVADREERK